MKCSFCGAELKEGILFCGNCGHRVEVERKQNCPNCGTALCKNENFCRECGYKISDFVEEDHYADKPICPNCGSIVKSDAAFCGACGFSLGIREDSSIDEKSSKRIWLITMVILVIVAFTVAAGFLYSNLHGKSYESVAEASVVPINHNNLETSALAETSIETTTITVETSTITTSIIVEEEKTTPHISSEDTLGTDADNYIETENKESDYDKSLGDDFNCYDGLRAFYGIWCYASKDIYEASKIAEILLQNGYYSASVYTTTDWSNLNTEKWYVVSAGAYITEDEAEAELAGVQSIYPNAYVKYSGDWQG